MAIRAAITPDSGLIAVEAGLTQNSYLFCSESKLRGGFACYFWFAGPHAGDFVVSVGGYHNRFKVPAHYPRPEPVGFVCKLGETLSLEGERHSLELRPLRRGA